MGAGDRILPPGPNPREDQMTEKEQKELRDFMRAQRRRGDEPGGRVPLEESESANQAEGEREGEPGRKLRGTPGQAEGGRRQAEEEIEKGERNQP